MHNVKYLSSYISVQTSCLSVGASVMAFVGVPLRHLSRCLSVQLPEHLLGCLLGCLETFVGASVRMSVEPSVGASIYLNCIMCSVLLRS